MNKNLILILALSIIAFFISTNLAGQKIGNNRDSIDCTLEIKNIQVGTSIYSFDVFITRHDPPWSENTAIGSLWGSFNSTLLFQVEHNAFCNPITTNLGNVINGTVDTLISTNFSTRLSIELISSGNEIDTVGSRLFTVSLQIEDYSTIAYPVWENENTTIFKSNNSGPATLDLINPSSTIQAEFSGDVTSGDAPLNINFIDLSTQGTSPIQEWFWDFGDGTDTTYTSVLDSIPHTYTQAGTYSVSLTITAANGLVSSEEKTDYIVVNGGGAVLPPNNVEISVQYPDLTITWDPVSNASGYKIYSSDNPFSGFENCATVTNTFWSSILPEEKKYYYVTAIASE